MALPHTTWEDSCSSRTLLYKGRRLATSSPIARQMTAESGSILRCFISLLPDGLSPLRPGLSRVKSQSSPAANRKNQLRCVEVGGVNSSSTR